MRIHFTDSNGTPATKLADVELHFEDGPLAGLKLQGFGLWESRSGGLNVTFPARSYSVNGERRSFALLRPLDMTTNASTLLMNTIKEAWDVYQAADAATVADGIGVAQAAGVVRR